jgi:hypothetical protein
VLKKRAGTILMVVDNQELPQKPSEEQAGAIDLEPLIQTSVEAIKILIQKDRGAST